MTILPERAPPAASCLPLIIVGFRFIACGSWTIRKTPQSAHQMMNRVGWMVRYY
jgi:hypothetical protein